MLTLNDIINVSFRKSNFAGYKTEDVDAFIDHVRESYEAVVKKTIEQKEEMEHKEEEKQQLAKKVELLAQRIEEYRGEEEEIKNALVSAQKLGDASIREARHKAEIIIKDAKVKADRMLMNAQHEVAGQRIELERSKKLATEFRTNLLEMYKKHLTMIQAIPTEQPAEMDDKQAEKDTFGAADPEEPEILTRREPENLIRREQAAQEITTQGEPAPGFEVGETFAVETAARSFAVSKREESTDEEKDIFVTVTNFDDTPDAEPYNDTYDDSDLGSSVFDMREGKE